MVSVDVHVVLLTVRHSYAHKLHAILQTVLLWYPTSAPQISPIPCTLGGTS